MRDLVSERTSSLQDREDRLLSFGPPRLRGLRGQRRQTNPWDRVSHGTRRPPAGSAPPRAPGRCPRRLPCRGPPCRHGRALCPAQPGAHGGRPLPGSHLPRDPRSPPSGHLSPAPGASPRLALPGDASTAPPGLDSGVGGSGPRPQGGLSPIPSREEGRRPGGCWEGHSSPRGTPAAHPVHLSPVSTGLVTDNKLGAAGRLCQCADRSQHGAEGPRDRSATPPGPSQPRPGPPASEGRPGAWHWAEAAGPSGLSLLQRRGPAFHGLGGSRSPQGGEVLHAAGLCRVPAHLRIWPRQCDPQRFTPIRTRASGPHHRQPAAGSGLRGADRCSYPGHPAPQPPGLRQLLPRGLTALWPVSGRRGHGRHVPAPVTRALPGTGGPKQRGGCPAHVTGTPRQGGGEGTTRDSPRTPAAPKRSKRPPRGVRVAGLQPARARPRPLPVPGGKRSPAEGVGPSRPPLREPSQSGPDLTARHRAVSWRWGPGPQEEPTPATRLPAAGSHAALSPPGLRGPQSHSDGAVTGPAAHRGKPCRA